MRFVRVLHNLHILDYLFNKFWLQGLRERWLADPRFLQRLAIEETISITTTLIAQYERRGDRFWKEIEYVITDSVRGAVVDFFTVWLPAPTLSFRTLDAQVFYTFGCLENNYGSSVVWSVLNQLFLPSITIEIVDHLQALDHEIAFMVILYLMCSRLKHFDYLNTSRSYYAYRFPPIYSVCILNQSHQISH